MINDWPVSRSVGPARLLMGSACLSSQYTSRAAQLYRQTLQKEADKMDKLEP